MTRRRTAVVTDVNVTYRTYADPERGLRELATRAQGRRRFTDVHAVKGVSLELFEGESVGIIGSNGSGKSTLLSAMTGLLPVDSGDIRVVSRPRLLGVGAALRPSVSGRRNIVIGALALGIPRQEIDARLDEVIDFADLGDAIDRPMRTLSSGQKSRLNFAVATLSAPDILFIDEALVVGDEAFKKKSQKRIDAIRESAGTVVLVTHNLSEVLGNCDRAFWLNKGEVRAEGNPVAVVQEYLDLVAPGSSAESMVPKLVEDTVEATDVGFPDATPFIEDVLTE